VAYAASGMAVWVVVAFGSIGHRATSTQAERAALWKFEAVVLAIAGVLTWLAVRWRFPLLSLACTLVVLVSPERFFAVLLGTIVFSHTTLVRMRRFETPAGAFNPHFVALCSGWLGIMTWALAWFAEDTSRGDAPWVAPALTLALSLALGVLAVLKRRQPGELAAANEPGRADYWNPSLTISFLLGAATLAINLFVAVALAVAIGTGSAAGGSSSLSCVNGDCSYAH
jgi:hypothetical protein